MQEGCFFCDELRRGYVPNPKGGTATDSWLPHEPGGPDCMNHLAEWDNEPRGPSTSPSLLENHYRKHIILTLPEKPFTCTELYDATAETIPEIDENTFRKHLRHLCQRHVVRLTGKMRPAPNGGTPARLYARGKSYRKRVAQMGGA